MRVYIYIYIRIYFNIKCMRTYNITHTTHTHTQRGIQIAIRSASPQRRNRQPRFHSQHSKRCAFRINHYVRGPPKRSSKQ